MKLTTVYATVFLVFLVMVSEANTALPPPHGLRQGDMVCCKLRLDCCQNPFVRGVNIARPNTVTDEENAKEKNW